MHRLTTLMPILLVACVDSAELQSADLDSLQRLRNANYSFDQIEYDTVHATIAGVGGISCTDAPPPPDVDPGSMIYTLDLDQAMIDQLNDILGAGGTNTLRFTMRTGLSNGTGGTGNVSGSIDVSGGSLSESFSVFEAMPPTGTINETFEVDIDQTAVDSLSAGDTITVTASGSGTAEIDHCWRGNQAIVTWYFTSGEAPLLSTAR